MARGWLVNDWLSCIPGSGTLWSLLLQRVPGLEDRTGAPYSILADRIEAQAATRPPDYVIRNAGYFRPLNLEVPTLALVQDVFESGPGRDLLVMVGEMATRVIFNSEYTRSHYPELDGVTIPIGIDTGLFSYSSLGNGVMFIGSTHPVKGFKRLLSLARRMPDVRFVAVLKEGWHYDPMPNLEIYRPMPQPELVALIRSCSVGVCLSTHETQHLAGIEMGRCGLPLVTTNVGVYYGMNPGVWGEVVQSEYDDAWEEAIRRRLGTGGPQVSEQWSVYNEDRCVQAWMREIDSCLTTTARP